MRTLRLALAQTNPTVGDLDGNTAKILEYVDRARAVDADIVAFPELAITGYPPEDLLFKPQLVRDNLDADEASGGGLTRHMRGLRVRGRVRRRAVQRRGRGQRRRACRRLPQDTAAQLRRLRRAALLHAGPRLPRVRDRGHARRRQHLRGHLVSRRPDRGAARGGRRGHREHQRLALRHGKAPRPGERDRGAGGRQRAVHRLRQHGGRAGRARLRRRQRRLRP